RKFEESKDENEHSLNTKESRKSANKGGESNGSNDKQKDYKNATDCTEHWDDPKNLERNQKLFKKFQEQNRAHGASEDQHTDDSAGGQKRGRGANATSTSNKKQKRNPGEQDKPVGAAGDKTRVPKKGQKVQWHSLPGYVDGEVIEVVYEEKKVDGKTVKASKEDPRIVLKSASSGKVCVHKPEVVYFD
ncbi:hypothetical protein BKA66DRAFT_391803, partial [Pyrenochaeta sp. MPI-SDFR-AT-0127]